MEKTKFPRRTLLQRGLLLVGCALGLVTAERRPGGEAVAAPSLLEPTRVAASDTLRLYGRGWRPQAKPPSAGRSSEGEHLVGYGELLDALGGEVVGRFCTNGFCPQTPFGHALAASPTLEFQTLVLNDGTVFGIGAGTLSGAAEHTYAILGGTGRFAGVGGTYTTRATSADGAGGAIEFTLTLTA